METPEFSGVDEAKVGNYHLRDAGVIQFNFWVKICWENAEFGIFHEI